MEDEEEGRKENGREKWGTGMGLGGEGSGHREKEGKSENKAQE